MQMKTLTVNGQTYTVTDANALHEEDAGGFVCAEKEQIFTPEQQIRARQNIGAAGIFVVELQDGNVASADAGQVYTAVQNGYYVVMHYESSYIPLAVSWPNSAYFSYLDVDYTGTAFQLFSNALVQRNDLAFPASWRYEEDIGGIKNTLDAQQEQINENTEAIKNIDAQSSGNYELIETITLTEETTLIERTQEPDGTPYNFRDVFIEVGGGDTEVSGKFLKWTFWHGEESYSIFRNLTIFDNYKTLLRTITDGNLRFAELLISTKNYGNAAYAYQNNANYLLTNENISKITTQHQTAMPIGTTIKIYAVRG